AKVFAVTDLAPVGKFRLSTDGKRLVAHLTGTTPDPGQVDSGTVVLWDFAEKKKFSYQLPPMPDLKEYAKAAPILHDFSADGRRVVFSYLIAGGKRALKVYDFLTGKVISLEYTGDWRGRVQFSPDGSLLLCCEIRKRFSGKPNLIHVLDLEKGAERFAISD